MELVQTFHTPSADRTPTSDISLRYIAAKGHGADTFLARPTITGRMDHTQTGRAVRSTLVLDGGTPTEQIEARDRLGGLTLAGFGGSPMWLPEGPVRVGQAWPVERFLDPRGVANARRQAQQTGLKAPEPTFSGTVRVVKATDGPEGKLLEVAIDALIEVAGPFEKGPERGHMSYANQVRGTAIIDARTGLPTSFECTEEVRTDVRQGAAQVQQRAVATVRATVQRKD